MKIGPKTVEQTINTTVKTVESMTKQADLPRNMESVEKLVSCPSQTLQAYCGIKPNKSLLLGEQAASGTKEAIEILANKTNAKVIDVNFAELTSPYAGVTSSNYEGIFEEICQKASSTPNERLVVNINELDIASRNNQVRRTILNGLERLKKFDNVTVVASSNAPMKGMDPTLLHRFDITSL